MLLQCTRRRRVMQNIEIGVMLCMLLGKFRKDIRLKSKVQVDYRYSVQVSSSSVHAR